MMGFQFFPFVALAGALLAGCRHTAVAPPPSDEGTSSYRFLEPPAPRAKPAEGSAGDAPPTMQALNAQPELPLAAPVYPAAALAAHAGAATVAVSITVDATGRVADIRPSPLNVPSPFAAEFRAAVEDALRQWRFRPAEIRHLELVKNPGGDFLRVTGREKIEWGFDVEFKFNTTGGVETLIPR